jgi:hypothetical protein
MSKRKQQEPRGHLLPAIIFTDRTIPHREFMLSLENAYENIAKE